MLVQDQFEIEDGILKAYVGSDKEIRIPEGVHTIERDVFKGMAWLIKVTFPSSLKKIGALAFKGCRQLREVTLPEGLSEVGEYAFHRCHSIEELIFPKTMTQVGECAFLYCDGLKKAVMEGPVRLGKGLFSHNLSLQELTINKNVDDSNFADEVFEGCVNLKRITLSGKSYEIDNLIEVMDSHTDYPQIIKTIAKSVYHSMQIEDGVLCKFSVNLKNLSLPEGITAIGKGSFFDKRGIVNLIFPKSLREIRANAFSNCSNLETITIQNEELLLDEKAFRGCNNLKRVHLGGIVYSLEEEVSDKLVGQIRDQVFGDFYISGKILIRYLGNEEQIQIPKEVEIIGERCFWGKEQLKTVLCPEGLREIREQAFEGCVTLQTIVLPGQLKRVEREAFAGCRKLLKCNIPENLEYIGEYAFRRCFSLPVFEPWPENAEIHPYAFYKAKHFAAVENELKKSYNDAITREKDKAGDGIAPYAFLKAEELKVLNLSGVRKIGKYAYKACPNLEEIVIDAPDCVVEQNAFSNCPNLRKVRLAVKKLGKGAFSYCRNLEEVRLNGVTVLPTECFAGCYALRVFETEEITRMEARCFDECIHLDSFDFSEIREIGERAFERCDSLKRIKLQKMECGYHAFADCAGLKELELSSETTLKSGSFIGCTQIHKVIFDGETYEFSRFSDSLNKTGNPYPEPVREVIASVYSCFDIRERKVLAGYSQDAARITIPEDIQEVGQDVFRDHVRLNDIRIPENVKLFGSHAFFKTTWLDEQKEKTDMVIVNQVLLDGTLCKGKVVLPLSVRRVASWCFAGNIALTELEIPSNRIGIESLAFRNCLNLKKITDWNGNEYVLNDVSDLQTKDYPELIRRIFTEGINCFKLDENRNLVESTGNITDLTLPQGIRSIGDGVYQDCHLLERIVLSDDTVAIGRSAFENSKWLKCVANAGAVVSIGAQAFSGCQFLETVELSDQLKKLGSRCFEHCVSLKEINLSGQLEKIPERAFFRCKSLKKLVISDTVKEIESEAFAFCEGLKEVYLPEETNVSDNAFAFCGQFQIHRYKALNV